MKPARGLRRLFAACAFVACGAVGAKDAPQLYAACAACHGVRAEGNPALGAPALAGQQAAYLLRQLRNFRSGLRGSHEDDATGAQMRAAAAVLPDDASAVTVAGYLAGLPKTTVTPAAGTNLRNGNNFYQGRCGACHGGRAEGNVALSAPRLAGLDAAYMKRQHRYFREGVRGANPEDRYGRQMSTMAKVLPTEKDLDDVIAFVHSLGTAR